MFAVIKALAVIAALACICLGGNVRAEESAAALMDQGRALIEQGDLASALQRFEAATQLEPTNAEAWYFAGTIYMRMNEIERGVGYLERSTELAPDNPRLRFVLAETYGRLRLVDKAIEHYRAVVGMAPNTPEGREAEKRSRILTGKKYAEQGDLERALQIFSSVLSEYPDDVSVMLDTGLVMLLLKRLDSAQALLERVALLQPDNGQAHSYLGDVYDLKGDNARAAEHYRRAVELLPPDFPPARVARLKLMVIDGLAHLNQGRPAEAAQVFEEVLALDPGNRAARVSLATAYRNLGEPAKAEALLLKLLEQNPADLDARLRLGALYLEERKIAAAARELEDVMSRGRGSPAARQAAEILGGLYASPQGKEIQARILEERINHYRAQIEKNPDDLASWSELALIYLSQRRRPEAIEAFENVVRLQPNNSRARVALGDLYDETSEFSKSIAAYTRALELGGEQINKEALRKQIVLVLAKKSYADDHLDLAETQFKSILEQDPNNFLAHFYMGLILTREERYEEALNAYLEVVRIVPAHLAARLNIAMLYEQLGREEDAVPEYRAVIRGGLPGMAETAQRRLKSLEQRIGGFSFSMNYSQSWDTNTNLSAESPTEELRSELGGNVVYRRKLRGKPTTLAMIYNPAYTIYHNGQFDFIQTELSPSVSSRWRGYDVSTSYTYSDSTGLMNEEISNLSQTFYADILKRFKMRPWLPFFTEGDDRDSVASAWRVNASYRTFESGSAPFFDSTIYSAGGLFNQSLSNGWSWSGSYNFTDYTNTRAIANDFAYNGHGLSFQLSKFLRPGWSANGSYTVSYSLYKNPDSVTRFTERRINTFQAVSGGLSFFYSDMLRFFANYSYQQNSSNLPTVFVLAPEDIPTGVFQSPSLGNYQKHVFTLGMGINF